MFKKIALPRQSAAISGCSAALLFTFTGGAGAQTNVLTQHNDNNRDGVNSTETVLHPSNVSQNQFGLLFKVAVDDQIFAQPLYVSNLSISGGNHNVVFVATANNSVYAFDADSGAQYWHVSLGTAFTVHNVSYNCNDVLGSSGIMSTPVIDGNTGTMYIVNETWDGSSASFHLHALNLANGADKSSPATITTNGFNTHSELQRTGLLLSGGNIYFAFASHCDDKPYSGDIFAYRESDLSQVGVIDPSPSDEGGIWQSGNGMAADSSGSVYAVTGNGTWDGNTNFGESFLKLNGTLGLQDWHTPSNPDNLNAGDADLGASGPLLISGAGLIIGGGKDGILHVVKTGGMGHLGDTTAVQNWQVTSSHIHSLNYWNNNLYLWGQGDYLQVFAFNGSTFNTNPKYKLGIQAFDHPGGTLSISANGNSNGILWASTNTSHGNDNNGAWHTTVPGILYAYDAGNVNLLWTSQQNAQRDSCNYYAKFTPPTISNGKVYLASFGYQQTNSGQLCVYGELPTTNLIPNGTYAIVSPFNGAAIEDPNSSTQKSVIMQMNSLTNSANQQWKVNNLGGNIVTLTNGASGQLLDVTAGSTGNSALIDQYPANNQTNQQWRVVSLGGGSYELISVNSGQALDIDGANKANGTDLDQYPYQGNAWQQWRFQAN